MDDPLVIASLLPPSMLFDANGLRWTLCASDRCFKNPVTSAFFKYVKVLPVSRGDGIYQKVFFYKRFVCTGIRCFGISVWFCLLKILCYESYRFSILIFPFPSNYFSLTCLSYKIELINLTSCICITYFSNLHHISWREWTWLFPNSIVEGGFTYFLKVVALEMVAKLWDRPKEALGGTLLHHLIALFSWIFCQLCLALLRLDVLVSPISLPCDFYKTILMVMPYPGRSLESSSLMFHQNITIKLVMQLLPC